MNSQRHTREGRLRDETATRDTVELACAYAAMRHAHPRQTMALTMQQQQQSMMIEQQAAMMQSQAAQYKMQV